jgi:peptide methionine sulfoxide reductase MsrA
MTSSSKGKGGPTQFRAARKEVSSLFAEVEREITQMDQQTKPLDLSKIVEAIEVLEKYTTAPLYDEKYLRQNISQLVTHKQKLWDVHEHVDIDELVDQKVELQRVLRLVGRATGKVSEGREDKI